MRLYVCEKNAAFVGVHYSRHEHWFTDLSLIAGGCNGPGGESRIEIAWQYPQNPLTACWPEQQRIFVSVHEAISSLSDPEGF
jgi:hypothetical protein